MKRFVVFLVVLLALSYSVFALAPLGGFAKAQEQTPVSTESTSSKTISQTSSDTSTSLDDLKEYLDGKIIITPSQKDVLSDMVSNAIKDAFELEEQLKKEVGTKFYANVGAAFGFKSTEIQYGVCGDMGIRFGKGFLMSVGVQYMLGNFGNVKLPDWNIEDMTVQAKIGWEW